MSFCSVINCMDGRVQEQVIRFLKNYYSVDYVDSITEPGPVGIISAGTETGILESIKNRLEISISKHNSVGIAIVAHHDCAGNPVSKDQQLADMKKSVEFIRSHYSQLQLIQIWVDENWNVHEIK